MITVKPTFAFVLPPVTASLQVGIATHFWINLALTILGGLPGILHPLWRVFSDRQPD